MFSQNYLSFEVVNLNNCKLLGIWDTSVYQDATEASGYTLQMLIPGYRDVIELTYYPNAITIINSNLLKLSNVTSPANLSTLPDGLYTAKISICPNEDNWYQESFYRTCKLECKFYTAFLNLEMNKCTSCYNQQKATTLRLVWDYIQGIRANVNDENFQKASELYTIANTLLDDLVNCDDCNGKKKASC